MNLLCPWIRCKVLNKEEGKSFGFGFRTTFDDDGDTRVWVPIRVGEGSTNATCRAKARDARQQNTSAPTKHCLSQRGNTVWIQKPAAKPSTKSDSVSKLHPTDRKPEEASGYTASLERRALLSEGVARGAEQLPA